MISNIANPRRAGKPSTAGYPDARRRPIPPNGNPIITHKFTADPTVIVHDGAVYLYTTHDEAPPGAHDYVIKEWLCFSSRDLSTWQEHPVPLRAADFAWSNGQAFASHVHELDGVFYWFASVADTAGDAAVAVATSTTPTGPFRDLLGRPLIARADLPGQAHAKANLDPAVLITAHAPRLVWGNGTCYTAPLTADLRALAGPITTIDLPGFQEGAHLHHRDGWYYLSYVYGIPERVAYAVSDHPEGPWTFAGLLNEVPGNCETNRPCILEFHGEWYFLYHNGALPDGDSHHRSVCIDRLRYNPDGTVQTVVMTSRGLY